MTVEEISATHSRVTPDECKMLYMGTDTTPYKVIICKHKQVQKIVGK